MRPGQLIAESFRLCGAVSNLKRRCAFGGLLPPDLTLAKAKWNSKSIKVSGFRIVLYKQILARVQSLSAQKKFTAGGERRGTDDP